ncbi:MAG: MMPL family transporter [Prolixibacteraceae bacterium]|jgi:hydrophobe/amphiphile efflux-3 (HAE3) family protein|nr:MMPL family transporter [Prolixibacteraceae bacterium]
MWQRLSSFILRYRVLLLILVTVFTIFMGYTGRKIEMSYSFAELLPEKDIAKQDYYDFVETFGAEGNIIAVGIVDSNFYNIKHYTRWSKLCKELQSLPAVDGFISIPNSYQLVKDTEKKKFNIQPIFPENIKNQQELDSLRLVLRSIPLYNNYLYDDSTNAYLAILTMNKTRMLTKEREGLVEDIIDRCKAFEKESNIEIKYSGLPYIHVRNSILIKREIFLFSVLALVVTLFILFLFFKSFKVMLFSAVVVLAGVATSLGTMVLFGYKVTILTGMVPPLLIVIGIPNCIYILNKYHHEYRYHKNQIKALKRVIMKIGNAIFLTNLTTASGFATFATTSSDMLKEFGVIASINIVFLFILSIILIPTIFSFLKPPEERHMKHLKRKSVGSIINKLISITENHRKKVYVAMFLILIVSVVGMTQMQTTGFLMDDIPENDPVKQDLLFFEESFDGIMPLEIVIDAKKPNSILKSSTMKKIEKLDKKFSEYEELSSSLSYINIVKMAKQAFYNGNEKYYSLPNNTERNFILSYVTNGDGDITIASSFIDSLQSKCRVSFRVKDIGTEKMDLLYDKIKDEVQQLFPADKYDTTVTGSMVVFFRGNQYLVGNLITSLALAVSLIAIFMAVMFRSRRMVIMSLIPNIIPLLFTAAIMGYAGIPIKPSTILVFSIAFGISVDNTIHFLAKYRQELATTDWNIKQSVYLALRETGVSMIYTSTVLVFGFGIFAFSNYGGTQALGILVSITLLVALTSNLVILPSLLVGLDHFSTTRSFKEPLLQIYDEEVDVDLDELEIESHPTENNKNIES